MNIERFEMIDKIESINVQAGQLNAVAHIPKESLVFEGHFPGFRSVPGVVLVEIMAQASGYLVLALNQLKQMPFLACIKQGNFRTFVFPGSTLTVNATLVREGSGYCVTTAEISCNGQKVSDAMLFFKVVKYPTAELQEHISERSRKLGLEDAVLV